MNALLSVSGLSKRYNDQVVLRDFSLAVAEGEFVTLLGPSGSGKTTALRIIAGFLAPNTGSISIGGHNVTTLSPHRRNIGFVFQDYALFPHLTVLGNLTYGLKVQRSPKAEQQRRGGELLELLDLTGLGARYPHELSGGQQQRVALGRALALEPQLLLMDEPLSNLDARLRERVGAELRSLQQRLGITTLYVTHDQQEALALSDRVAVLSGGTLQDVSTPHELYAHPKNLFAAQFVGHGSTVRVHEVLAHGEPTTLRTGLGAVQATKYGAGNAGGVVFYRPEHLTLQADGTPATVVATSYLGNTVRISARISTRVGADTVLVDMPPSTIASVGDTVYIAILRNGIWYPDIT